MAGRVLVGAAGVLLAWLALHAAWPWFAAQQGEGHGHRVSTRAAEPLPADEMLRRLSQQGLQANGIEAITLWRAPGRAAQARTGDGQVHEFDPYTGELTWHGPVAAQQLPGWTTALWVTSSGCGLLTLATLLSLAACIWRWRRPGRLPAWQRALLVAATLAATVHLVAAACTWGWPAREQVSAATNNAAPSENLAEAWQHFDAAVAGAYERVTLQWPARQGEALHFDYQARGDAPWQPSRISLTAAGDPLTHEPWQALPLARQLPALLPALHGGQWLGAPGVGFMLLASLLLPLLAGWPRVRAVQAAAPAGEELLVVYASQSGTAEQIARRSAAALQAGGQPARVADLGHLHDAGRLAQAGRVLFVLATTGQGEVPDHARPFAHRLLPGQAALHGLRYGLLSLGDRSYENFCAFGRAVDGWLQRGGAQPLFAPIEVDRGDTTALQAWQQQLAALCGPGVAAAAPWQAPEFDTWRLARRRCLNPGSAGPATFHLEIEPVDASIAHWQAGDIAEVWCPDGDRGEGGGAVREYSIASIEADGAIDLLVRQTRHPDGRLGLGSGWLTERLQEGAELCLRVRGNAGFHAPADEGRPMVLIGNGTGLAGLRAHLRQRARSGRPTRNWLLFGERNAAHDFYFRDEIEAWQREGLLTHVNLAFSRDQSPRVYVQHRLQERRERLAAWLADGAAVYVCGSAAGMAPEVEAVLRDVVGAAQLDELVAAGRYRRDVY